MTHPAIAAMYSRPNLKSLQETLSSHCQWCDSVRMIHKNAHVLMCLGCDTMEAGYAR